MPRPRRATFDGQMKGPRSANYVYRSGGDAYIDAQFTVAFHDKRTWSDSRRVQLLFRLENPDKSPLVPRLTVTMIPFNWMVPREAERGITLLELDLTESEIARAVQKALRKKDQWDVDQTKGDKRTS